MSISIDVLLVSSGFVHHWSMLSSWRSGLKLFLTFIICNVNFVKTGAIPAQKLWHIRIYTYVENLYSRQYGFMFQSRCSININLEGAKVLEFRLFNEIDVQLRTVSEAHSEDPRSTPGWLIILVSLTRIWEVTLPRWRLCTSYIESKGKVASETGKYQSLAQIFCVCKL